MGVGAFGGSGFCRFFVALETGGRISKDEESRMLMTAGAGADGAATGALVERFGISVDLGAAAMGGGVGAGDADFGVIEVPAAGSAK